MLVLQQLSGLLAGVFSLSAVTGKYPDSKVHGTNVGPIWGRQDPGGLHVGPMNLAIWVDYLTLLDLLWKTYLPKKDVSVGMSSIPIGRKIMLFRVIKDKWYPVSNISCFLECPPPSINKSMNELIRHFIFVKHQSISQSVSQTINQSYISLPYRPDNLTISRLKSSQHRLTSIGIPIIKIRQLVMVSSL